MALFRMKNAPTALAGGQDGRQKWGKKRAEFAPARRGPADIRFLFHAFETLLVDLLTPELEAIGKLAPFGPQFVTKL